MHACAQQLAAVLMSDGRAIAFLVSPVLLLLWAVRNRSVITGSVVLLLCLASGLRLRRSRSDGQLSPALDRISASRHSSEHGRLGLVMTP